MKRSLLISLLIAATTLVGCSTKSFTLEGKIEGLSGKVYLAVLQGKLPQIIDSTEVNPEGTFTFKGHIERPMMALLQNSDKESVSMFMLENSPITITGSISELDSVKIQGSAENDLYRAMTAQLSNVKSTEEYQTILTDFINANPTSYAAGYALFRQLSPMIDYKAMREMASTLDTSVQHSVYIEKLLANATMLEATSIGHPFVDFTAPNLEGVPTALSSVAGKGKWVLLDFWASWCAPCRMENPHVVKAYKEFADRGFTVFGYSLDRSYDDWKQGVAKDSLGEWTNVSDLAFWESAPAATYGVSSIPSNVLINPEGMIVERNLRGEELIEYLSENLKK